MPQSSELEGRVAKPPNRQTRQEAAELLLLEAVAFVLGDKGDPQRAKLLSHLAALQGARRG